MQAVWKTTKCLKDKFVLKRSFSSTFSNAKQLRNQNQGKILESHLIGRYIIPLRKASCHVTQFSKLIKYNYFFLELWFDVSKRQIFFTDAIFQTSLRYTSSGKFQTEFNIHSLCFKISRARFAGCQVIIISYYWQFRFHQVYSSVHFFILLPFWFCSTLSSLDGAEFIAEFG